MLFNKPNLVILYLLVSSIGVCGLHNKCKGQTISQSVIATSGYYAVNGNTSLSYTIGEPMVQTIYSAKNTLTQGFQQPFDSLVISQDSSKNSISEFTIEENFSISVYPNPFSNYLFIKLQSPASDDIFTLELFNTLGQECILPITVEYKGGENTYKINTGDLAMGIYVLFVKSSANKDFKSILLNRTLY